MSKQKSVKVLLSSIGIIHTPFTTLEEMPIQPSGRASAAGFVELFSQYRAGLKDIEGFSHVILLYHLHRVERVDLTVKPFLNEELRGIFATRAPTRPNPIGLSIVRFSRVEENRVYFENIDILDGTPLLDIKPYVPEFDQPSNVRIGWLASVKGQIRDKKSDDRFLS